MSYREMHYRDADLHVASLFAGGSQVFSRGFPGVGTDWFVHGTAGSANGTGRGGWANALSTVDAVFDQAGSAFRSGDRIFIAGTIAEQLVSPAGIFDVAMIGVGYGNPRHTDAHAAAEALGGSRGAVRWKEPASGAAAGALLRVQQQGWYFENILFTPGATATIGLEFYTDNGAGDSERDASHGIVNNCRFSGAGIGIRYNGQPNFMGVFNSRFDNMTTGIGFTVGAGAKTHSWFKIENNFFATNTNHLVVSLTKSIVRRNYFLDGTASIVLTNGGGSNIVTENYIHGNYDASAGCAAASGDSWYNNYSSDTTSAEVSDELAASPSGFTFTVPA